MRILLITLALVVLSSCKPESPNMTFVALGDAPYHTEGYPSLESLIKKVNTTKPSLIIHTGDTHGHYTCDNTTIDNLRRYMNDFVAPVLYTPGDNDWTDCAKYSDFDPVERLKYLRQSHYSSGSTLGARPLPVFDQNESGYPENIRFTKDNIGFITLHVVGSYNNMITSDSEKMKEFYARNKANLIWLEESFKILDNTDAIVVALHASMFERRLSLRKFASKIKKDKKLFLSFKTYEIISVGVIQKLREIFKILNYKFALPFREIGELILKNSSDFNRPVLLLHGDTHNYRTYKPFKKKYPYFHAIET